MPEEEAALPVLEEETAVPVLEEETALPALEAEAAPPVPGVPPLPDEAAEACAAVDEEAPVAWMETRELQPPAHASKQASRPQTTFNERDRVTISGMPR
jgi:hypothetical protein